MKWFFSIRWVLVASVWYFGKGLLSDVFALINHNGKYDKELLQKLTYGHILLLSGAVVFVCYLMMVHKIQYGNLINIIIGIGMLIYCALIYTFLKSIDIIVISIILIIVSVKSIHKFPDVYGIMQKFK